MPSQGNSIWSFWDASMTDVYRRTQSFVRSYVGLCLEWVRLVMSLCIHYKAQCCAHGPVCASQTGSLRYTRTQNRVFVYTEFVTPWEHDDALNTAYRLVKQCLRVFTNSWTRLVFEQFIQWSYSQLNQQITSSLSWMNRGKKYSWRLFCMSKYPKYPRIGKYHV